MLCRQPSAGCSIQSFPLYCLLILCTLCDSHATPLQKLHVCIAKGAAIQHHRACCLLQVTILKEFCQGPNQMMYSLPAGSFDAQRHGDYAGCARAELWEEVSSCKCTSQVSGNVQNPCSISSTASKCPPCLQAATIAFKTRRQSECVVGTLVTGTFAWLFPRERQSELVYGILRCDLPASVTSPVCSLLRRLVLTLVCMLHICSPFTSSGQAAAHTK